MGKYERRDQIQKRIEESDVDEEQMVWAPVWRTSSKYFHWFDDDGECVYNHGWDGRPSGLYEMEAGEAMKKGYAPCKNCMRELGMEQFPGNNNDNDN